MKGKDVFLKRNPIGRVRKAVATALVMATVLSTTAVLPVFAQDIVTVAETDNMITQLDVTKLNAAQTANQLCIVTATGTTAYISLHNRDAYGNWYPVFSCRGYVGANGLGKTVYGDKKTPVGIYHFTQAFGIKPNPGTQYFPYYQVDDRYYWLGTGGHPYFNELVIANQPVDGEHIIDYGKDYYYVLSIDYNSQKDPYKGSAIFFHVETGGPTAGCVSMPESNMIQLITNARQDCVVIIDSPERIGLY